MTEEAPKSDFKIKRWVDEEQLKKDLAFTTVNLSDAMMAQASLFAHYGVLAANCSRQVDSLELLLENAEARVYRALRDKAAEDGTKVTEAQLDKAVSIHASVLSLKKALNEARQIESVAKIAVEAFKHRRDMLIQQGLISREEMKGELSINLRSAQEELLEAQKRRVLDQIRKD